MEDTYSSYPCLLTLNLVIKILGVLFSNKALRMDNLLPMENAHWLSSPPPAPHMCISFIVQLEEEELMLNSMALVQHHLPEGHDLPAKANLRLPEGKRKEIVMLGSSLRHPGKELPPHREPYFLVNSTE